MNNIPDDWTDDMTISIPVGHTVEEMVDFVIQQALSHIPREQIQLEIIYTFGISGDDADLVCDRVFGGIVRAATGQISNLPNQIKDPFAHISYKYAVSKPTIISVIYPDLFRAKHRPWWKFWA